VSSRRVSLAESEKLGPFAGNFIDTEGARCAARGENFAISWQNGADRVRLYGEARIYGESVMQKAKHHVLCSASPKHEACCELRAPLSPPAAPPSKQEVAYSSCILLAAKSFEAFAQVFFFFFFFFCS